MSRTITLEIDCPYEVVASYLADPHNYAEWAAVYPETYRKLPSGDWQAEVRFGGIRHIRFSPPNENGVFDHAVFEPGQDLLWMPMRIMPLAHGTRLDFTFIQRPGMDREHFNKTVEWVTSDLMTLKAVLQSRRG